MWIHPCLRIMINLVFLSKIRNIETWVSRKMSFILVIRMPHTFSYWVSLVLSYIYIWTLKKIKPCFPTGPPRIACPPSPPTQRPLDWRPLISSSSSSARYERWQSTHHLILTRFLWSFPLLTGKYPRISLPAQMHTSAHHLRCLDRQKREAGDRGEQESQPQTLTFSKSVVTWRASAWLVTRDRM